MHRKYPFRLYRAIDIYVMKIHYRTVSKILLGTYFLIVGNKKSFRNKNKVISDFTNFIFFLHILTDIQEFYEFTLLDESKSTQQKTLETLQIASKWEREPPITTVTQPKLEVNNASRRWTLAIKVRTVQETSVVENQVAIK